MTYLDPVNKCIYVGYKNWRYLDVYTYSTDNKGDIQMKLLDYMILPIKS